MTKVNVGADVAMEDVSQGDISDLIEPPTAQKYREIRGCPVAVLRVS